MIFVVPAFKDVFKSFGADLPAPTLVVIAMSDFFVSVLVHLIFGTHRRRFYFFVQAWKRSPNGAALRSTGSMLKLPVLRRSDAQGRRSRAGAARWRRCSPPACRWSRRSTRSAGASGNYVY